ncbi:hypothetical protein [Pareuzebyella sediminis]|uniref:hypothetical protein n=1 Tax=Pareuzebyella sediminis TaxID=2607998 RepID=UPI0011F0083F|nr:hypothetical protein [Pareuzebyella sediminis]
MSVFESLNETSNKAVDVGEQLYKKTQEYYKLKVFQQLALTTGMLFKMAIMCSLAFLGLLFFLVGGTLYLSDVFGSLILACIVVGGILLVATVIIYFLRKRIDNYVVRKLSIKFFD